MQPIMPPVIEKVLGYKNDIEGETELFVLYKGETEPEWQPAYKILRFLTRDLMVDFGNVHSECIYIYIDQVVDG